MDGEDFQRIAREAFAPFLRELGFTTLPPSISGKFYSVNFDSPSNRVAIAFEPGEDEVTVVVLGYREGGWSDMDDRVASPRLADLNARFLGSTTRDERAANEAAFAAVAAEDDAQRRLLKAARELRLVLPKYLDR